MSIQLRDEAGFAMLVAVMSLLIMSAAGLSLTISISNDGAPSVNFTLRK